MFKWKWNTHRWSLTTWSFCYCWRKLAYVLKTWIMPTSTLKTKSRFWSYVNSHLYLPSLFLPLLLSSTFTRIYTPTSCSQIVTMLINYVIAFFQLDSNNDSLNGFSKALVASWGGAFTQTWHNCCFLLVSTVSLKVLIILMEHTYFLKIRFWLKIMTKAFKILWSKVGV